MTVGGGAIDGLLMRVLPRLDRARHGLRDRRRLDRALAPLPAILADLPPSGEGRAGAWVVRWRHWSATGVALAGAGRVGAGTSVVAKLAGSPESVAALAAAREALETLADDARLADWRGIIPAVIDHGERDGTAYLVQTAMPGIPAERSLRDPSMRARLLPAAARTISELHGRTGAPLVVDEERLGAWVDAPLRMLSGSLRPDAYGPEVDRNLAQLGSQLRARLAGRTVMGGWSHGDYWPGNLLVTPDGRRITGIVDWDQAAPDQLLTHDVLHLLLYTRRLLDRRELGDVVRGLLSGDHLDRVERGALEVAGLDRLGRQDLRYGIVLAWLRHVAAFAPTPGHGSSRRWVRRNVVAVLRELSGPDGLSR